MATLILRPNSDISIGHTKSSGSSGYSLINEVTPDGDTTYIYQAVSSTSATSKSSTFSFTGFDLNKIQSITSATFYVVAKNSANYAQTSTISATIGSQTMQARSLTTAYQSITTQISSSTISSWNSSISSGNVPSLQVTITTTGSATSGSKSTNSYQMRITQSYIEIEYEPKTNIRHTIGVGDTAYATTSITKTSGLMNEEVTVAIYNIADNYEFKGWYSEPSYTNLISQNYVYTFYISGDITLYPKLERPTYTVTITTAMSNLNFSALTKLEAFSADYSSLTQTDLNDIHNSNFSSISSSKKYDTNSGSSLLGGKQISITISCPKGACVALYGTRNIATSGASVVPVLATANWTLGVDDINNAIAVGTDWFIVQNIENNTSLYYGMGDTINITLDKGLGISTTNTQWNPSAEGVIQEFSCTLKDHYVFDGWYKNANYTQKITSNQTDSWAVPHGRSSSLIETIDVTYYARAIPDYSYWTRLMYRNSNTGSYQPIRQVYQKTSQGWIAVNDTVPFSAYTNGTRTHYKEGD